MNSWLIVPSYIAPQACSPECIFCHPTAGRVVPAFEVPTIEALERHVRAQLASRRKLRVELAWYGGPLGLDAAQRERLLSLTEQLVDRGLIASARLTARPDQISREVARLLAESGVRLVELDVPSLAWRVLSQMGPAHAEERVEQAVDWLREAGIQVGVQLRPGLPGSDLEQELETVGRLIAMAPAFFRLHPALVIRGTWLERYHQAGRYVPMTLEEAVRTCRILVDRILAAAIPVARVGLQPMRDLHLEPDCVVGGPYHPSLRTLIEAERMYERAVRALPEQILPGRHLTLFVAPVSESNLRGPENSNLHRLRRRFHYASITVEVDAGMSREEVRARISAVRLPRGQRFAS